MPIDQGYTLEFVSDQHNIKVSLTLGCSFWVVFHGLVMRVLVGVVSDFYVVQILSKKGQKLWEHSLLDRSCLGVVLEFKRIHREKSKMVKV